MGQKRMAPQFDMGDPIETGTPGHPGYVPAAYNYPAGIRAPNQDWDVYLTGTFIYWKPHQDNMFTGFATNQANPQEVEFAFNEGSPSLNNALLFSRKPGYRPGFKVGLGWNTGSWDNWTLYGEYTWFHTGKGTDDSDANPCGECGCVEVLLVPSCECPIEGLYANDLKSKWKLDVDMADFIVSRPAYQGKRLVLSPFFGLRGLWIRQKFDVTYDAIMPDVFTITPVGTYSNNARSKAWAVGPRIGVDGSWLFGCGFRMIGNASASILYQRFTDIDFKSNIPNGVGGTFAPTGTPLVSSIEYDNQKNYGTVRPNFEIDAGLGWGMYVGDCYHIDFEARYDFHVFWGQNMMTSLQNYAVQFADTTPGNLYLHGLTVKARFDF